MAFDAFYEPWPDHRILCADRDFLVVDKLWGVPVHGGRDDVDDIVTRLKRWLDRRGEDSYLAVHQRLDCDASGVLLFVRNPELNPVIASAFEQHRIERSYLAVIEDNGLPDECAMVDRMHTPQKGPSSITNTGGVRAEAAVSVLARRGGRALVKLSPQTGRRHQLRLQLSHRRCPIVGDTLYGGEPGPRLMLHAICLGLPELQRRFESTPPPEFEAWAKTEGLGDSARARQALSDAAYRRSALFRSNTTAFRLANEKGDGLPGVRLDRYGEFAVLELTTAESQSRRSELANLVHAMGAHGVYVKCRLRADLRNQKAEALAPHEPDVGQSAPDLATVIEESLRFEVSLGDGWDTGLYTDQRANRARVLAAAEDRRVLNLFCYTGSFTVAAAKGRALSTTSVDISRRALTRTQRNLQLNGIELGASHRLLRADAVDFMRRAVARRDTYDLIILDPPSFSTTGKKRVFQLESTWPLLIESAISLLSRGGQCLFVTHELSERAVRLRHRVKEACDRLGRTASAVRDLPSGSDCPDQPEGPCPSRSIWLQLA